MNELTMNLFYFFWHFYQHCHKFTRKKIQIKGVFLFFVLTPINMTYMQNITLIFHLYL